VKVRADTLIRKELKVVEREAKAKTKKLAVATDSHTGLEILHLFILDLLGRETSAAQIFRSKTEEDFSHTKVVTRIAKWRTMLILVSLNAFFVYYSLLKAYTQGIEWQRLYLVSCIYQAVAEIVLNETLECAYVNWMVPSLVADEVGRVNTMLLRVISNLIYTPQKEAFNDVLNAADYLFVSTAVASQYPAFLESAVVRTYHTIVPGELSKKWLLGPMKQVHRYNDMTHATVLSVVLLSIQRLATAPFMVQRVLLRVTQPIITIFLLIIGNVIMGDVLVLGVFCGVVVSVVAWLLLRYREAQMRDARQHLKVLPLMSPGKDRESDDEDGSDGEEEEEDQNGNADKDISWNFSNNESDQNVVVVEEGGGFKDGDDDDKGRELLSIGEKEGDEKEEEEGEKEKEEEEGEEESSSKNYNHWGAEKNSSRGEASYMSDTHSSNSNHASYNAGSDQEGNAYLSATASDYSSPNSSSDGEGYSYVSSAGSNVSSDHHATSTATQMGSSGGSVGEVEEEEEEEDGTAASFNPTSPDMSSHSLVVETPSSSSMGALRRQAIVYNKRGNKSIGSDP
jgi:hypothetical protein